MNPVPPLKPPVDQRKPSPDHQGVDIASPGITDTHYFSPLIPLPRKQGNLAASATETGA